MMLLVTPDTTKAGQIARACDVEVDFHHIEHARPDPALILSFIENNDVDVVVLGPEMDEDVGELLISDISAAHPFLGVLLFVRNKASSIRCAFRAGAADVLTPGMGDEEIAETIVQVRERMDHRFEIGAATIQNADTQSKVITVLSPRGGVGRTLVATSLAATLERRHPGEVVLVDLDLQGGDVAPLLGLSPHLSIASVAGRATEIDSADVKALLTQDQDGLHLLAAPQSLTAAVEVGPELVTAMLKLLSASFKYVVIDTGTYLSEVSLAALDSTTDLLLICAPDVPSVRALGRATDALDELRVIAPRRHLVVNKATARYGMPLRDIEAVSGMTPIAQVPAAKEIAMALNRGTQFQEVVHARSVVPKALKDLVAELAPERSSASTKRRLLGRAR